MLKVTATKDTKLRTPWAKRKAPRVTASDRPTIAIYTDPADGYKVPVKVLRQLGGGKAEVHLGVPGADGLIYFTDSKTVIDSANVGDRVDREVAGVDGKVRSWTETQQVDVNSKALVTVRGGESGEIVTDYRGVSIEGFGSTFQEETPQDRDGDHVLPGAFTATLAQFRSNPVMLADHQNSVHQIAGSFSKVGTNRLGLAVTGNVSDSPNMIDIRFKIVEGHLRALSMGGMFFYADNDFFSIERVDLWEISLVAIPANPDALFEVRAVSLDDVKSQMRYLSKCHHVPGASGKVLGMQPQRR